MKPKSVTVELTVDELDLLIDDLRRDLLYDMFDRPADRASSARLVALWGKRRAGYVKEKTCTGPLMGRWSREDALESRDSHDLEAGLLSKLATALPMEAAS